MEYQPTEALFTSPTEELTQASHKLAEAMYQTAQQAGGSEEAAGQSAGSGHATETSEADDNVIDAEFVETDADKN